jgi:mersacidin/lichenicidin family type 2 lantibiotic
MSQTHIARAWKDPEYRASLSAEQLAVLPANPVGAIELTDADLSQVDGGSLTPATIAISFEMSCYTWNSTNCNGTCAFMTIGCCG